MSLSSVDANIDSSFQSTVSEVEVSLFNNCVRILTNVFCLYSQNCHFITHVIVVMLIYRINERIIKCTGSHFHM